MPIIRIDTLGDDAALKIFVLKTDRELKVQNGLFLGESPNVICRALGAGIKPVAILCEEESLDSYSHIIGSLEPEVPVYIAPRDILSSLTGYKMSRGVTGAFMRSEMPSLERVTRSADSRPNMQKVG